MSTDSNVVNISLNRDEAIVLFEFLTRYSEAPQKLRIEHQSEQRVLWDMQAQLESTLQEPINNPSYEKRVAEARESVRDKA
jgi:hypothetical protein